MSLYTIEFWSNFFPCGEEWAELARLARLSLASPAPFLSPVGLLSESDGRPTAAKSSKLSDVFSKLEFMNNKKSITNPLKDLKIYLSLICPQIILNVCLFHIHTCIGITQLLYIYMYTGCPQKAQLCVWRAIEGILSGLEIKVEWVLKTSENFHFDEHKNSLFLSKITGENEEKMPSPLA